LTSIPAYSAEYGGILPMSYLRQGWSLSRSVGVWPTGKGSATPIANYHVLKSVLPTLVLFHWGPYSVDPCGERPKAGDRGPRGNAAEILRAEAWREARERRDWWGREAGVAVVVAFEKEKERGRSDWCALVDLHRWRIWASTSHL
jgi:hypothetical protein